MSQQKTVRDILTRNIVSVEQNKTALEGARLMTESSFSSLIVHDDDDGKRYRHINRERFC